MAALHSSVLVTVGMMQLQPLGGHWTSTVVVLGGSPRQQHGISTSRIICGHAMSGEVHRRSLQIGNPVEAVLENGQAVHGVAVVVGGGVVGQ